MTVNLTDSRVGKNTKIQCKKKNEKKSSSKQNDQNSSKEVLYVSVSKNFETGFNLDDINEYFENTHKHKPINKIEKSKQLEEEYLLQQKQII